MSIELMSAIFRTQFRDLQDADGNTTKASTAKFVCIALADHANDEGEGAYPSLARISYKTSLSRTAVINAIDALKHNGILTANGQSKFDTINYTVNPRCFSQDRQPAQLVNWIDPPSQPGTPPLVNPVDPNHTLTIPEPLGDKSPIDRKDLSVEWQMLDGKPIVLPDERQSKRKDAASLIGMGLGVLAESAAALALAFQTARDITFTEGQIKGQRKAAKELLAQKVTPEIVAAAVRKLTEAGMTVTDLYSVTKTCIDLANKTEAPKSGRSLPTIG